VNDFSCPATRNATHSLQRFIFAIIFSDITCPTLFFTPAHRHFYDTGSLNPSIKIFGAFFRLSIRKLHNLLYANLCSFAH
jgi:hypothetical protein